MKAALALTAALAAVPAAAAEPPKLDVVLTPHLGWPTDHAYQRFASAACE